MKSVNVRYFAILRELAGKEHETLQIECSTYAELYRQLTETYSFNLNPEIIQVAVNDEFAELNSQILDGARVVFIPPVAGG